MIRRCNAFQCSRGNSRFKSVSVCSTFFPLVSFHRCASRWICVSTGNAGTPNACAITTLAVLWPTPGNSSSSANVLGTSPPWRSINSRDSSRIACAFLGARPHGRTIASISATVRRAIATGLSASLNSAGVTTFTRLSVHCAESSTAMSNV